MHHGLITASSCTASSGHLRGINLPQAPHDDGVAAAVGRQRRHPLPLVRHIVPLERHLRQRRPWAVTQPPLRPFAALAAATSGSYEPWLTPPPCIRIALPSHRTAGELLPSLHLHGGANRSMPKLTATSPSTDLRGLGVASATLPLRRRRRFLQPSRKNSGLRRMPVPGHRGACDSVDHA